jgi:hypothetical protein
MSRIRLAVGTIVVAAALALSAQAQTPAPKKPAAEPSTTAKVETWTQKKWDATKHEWQKDRAKWDACNQRATDQHLTGRKSWSYIYDCMKA